MQMEAKSCRNSISIGSIIPLQLVAKLEKSRNSANDHSKRCFAKSAILKYISIKTERRLNICGVNSGNLFLHLHRIDLQVGRFEIGAWIRISIHLLDPWGEILTRPVTATIKASQLQWFFYTEILNRSNNKKRRQKYCHKSFTWILEIPNTNIRRQQRIQPWLFAIC